MASTSTPRKPRTRLPLTPSVTTVRRGAHRAPSAAPAPAAAATAVGRGLTLLRSARGVRLDRS